MKVKISKWGNSLGLRLPRSVVDDLGLKPGQVVDFRRRGSRVELETRPEVAGIPVYRLEDIVAEMDRLGPENEPETVEWGPDVGAEIIDDDYSRGKTGPGRR